MFILGLSIGLVLGANISLFLYAMIIIGKQSDERGTKVFNKISKEV